MFLSLLIGSVVFFLLSFVEIAINDSEISIEIKQERLKFEKNLLTIITWGIIQAVCFFPYIMCMPQLKTLFGDEAIVASIANLFVAPILLNCITIVLTLFFKKLEEYCNQFFFCPTKDESILFYYFAGLIGVMLFVATKEVTSAITLGGAIFVTPVVKYITNWVTAAIRGESRPKTVFEKCPKFVSQTMVIALAIVYASAYAQDSIFYVICALLVALIAFILCSYYKVYTKVYLKIVENPFVHKIVRFVQRKKRVWKAGRVIAKRAKRCNKTYKKSLKAKKAH